MAETKIHKVTTRTGLHAVIVSELEKIASEFKELKPHLPKLVAIFFNRSSNHIKTNDKCKQYSFYFTYFKGDESIVVEMMSCRDYGVVHELLENIKAAVEITN